MKVNILNSSFRSISENASNPFQSFTNCVSEGLQKIANKVSVVWKALVKYILKMWECFTDTASNMCKNLEEEAKYIYDNPDKVERGMKEVASDKLRTLKHFFSKLGRKMPSREKPGLADRASNICSDAKYDVSNRGRKLFRGARDMVEEFIS